MLSPAPNRWARTVCLSSNGEFNGAAFAPLRVDDVHLRATRLHTVWQLRRNLRGRFAPVRIAHDGEALRALFDDDGVATRRKSAARNRNHAAGRNVLLAR